MHFSQHPLFLSSHHIACYLAKSDEFDSEPLIELLWDKNKICYLPVLQKDQLGFSVYTPLSQMKANRYQILEPVAQEQVLPHELDLVIMPLIGFDSEGHRLGTGGGYYDKTFSFCAKPSVRKPFLLGLGFSSQEISHIPNDAWDICLDGILTEKGLLLFGSDEFV